MTKTPEQTSQQTAPKGETRRIRISASHADARLRTDNPLIDRTPDLGSAFSSVGRASDPAEPVIDAESFKASRRTSRLQHSLRHPEPRPSPDWAQETDKEAFLQRWQADVDAAKDNNQQAVLTQQAFKLLRQFQHDASDLLERQQSNSKAITIR